MRGGMNPMVTRLFGGLYQTPASANRTTLGRSNARTMIPRPRSDAVVSARERIHALAVDAASLVYEARANRTACPPATAAGAEIAQQREQYAAVMLRRVARD
jgi:hypothetical protein